MKVWISITILMASWMMSCADGSTQTNNNKVTSVHAQEFAELIKKNVDAQLIDVRTPQEFSGGYIENAMNLDYNGDDYSRQVAALDKEKMVLIYCLSGGRSGSAAEEMRKNGFQQVIELNGGILNWKKANLPLIQSAIKKPLMQKPFTSLTFMLPGAHHAKEWLPCWKNWKSNTKEK
jgi:thioredoxin 1